MPHLNSNDNSSSVLPYNMTEEWIKYGFKQNKNFSYKILALDDDKDFVIGWVKKTKNSDETTLCKWNLQTGFCIAPDIPSDNKYDLEKDSLYYISLVSTSEHIKSSINTWEHFLKYAARVGLFKNTLVLNVAVIKTTTYFLEMIAKLSRGTTITFKDILEYVKKDL